MKPPTSHAHGSHHSPDEMHNDDVAHEHSDVNVRAILSATAIIAVVCVVSAALMYGLFGFFESQAAGRDPRLSPLARPASNLPANTVQSPSFGGAPEPRLLTNEPKRLEEVRAAAQEQLGGYGWVDEKAGVARIPIDEAKRLIAERGLPVRPDPVEDPAVGTRVPARGESSSGRAITQPPTVDPAPLAPAPASAPAETGKKGH